MVIVSTIWMLVIDVALGLVAVIVFPMLVATNVVYERLVSGHFARAQHQLGEFSAGVHESFEGVQLVKSYGAEERETERLSGLADQVRVSRVHALRLRSWFEAFLDVIPSLTNILLVVIGSLRVRSGDLSIGELSGVIFLFTLLDLPASPDRLRPLGAPSLDRRVESDPDGAPRAARRRSRRQDHRTTRRHRDRLRQRLVRPRGRRPADDHRGDAGAPDMAT